jgi:CRP/FNR family cyclic AMP-dependent transcriptional regulator
MGLPARCQPKIVTIWLRENRQVLDTSQAARPRPRTDEPIPNVCPVPAHGGRPHIMIARLADWTDAKQRAHAIAKVPPFTAWPADALLRLARASRVVKHRRGENIVSRGEQLDAVYLVVEGNVSVAISAATGRTVVFAAARPLAAVFGVASLVDGRAMTNDVIADESTISVAIPSAAVRAELARTPTLWESVAQELSARARIAVEGMSAFIFEPLRPRMVRLLLALAASTGARSTDGQVTINVRLTQERFADMLGVTRQAVTPLLRAFAHDGLLRWRYGRVTLLDRPRLEAQTNPSRERESSADQPATHGRRRAG